MINDLIKKLLPVVDKAEMFGDHDCIRFDFFEGKVILRFNPYQGLVNQMWLDQYDVHPAYISELDAELKRQLNNALSAECKAWLEASVAELGE